MNRIELIRMIAMLTLTSILVVLAMTPPASNTIADEINRACELVIGKLLCCFAAIESIVVIMEDSTRPERHLSWKSQLNQWRIGKRMSENKYFLTQCCHFNERQRGHCACRLEILNKTRKQDFSVALFPRNDKGHYLPIQKQPAHFI